MVTKTIRAGLAHKHAISMSAERRRALLCSRTAGPLIGHGLDFAGLGSH